MNEIEQKARDILYGHGIVVDQLDTSGKLVYCGTIDKPHSKNGRYILHIDEPSTLFYMNWQTGDTGSRVLIDFLGVPEDQRKVWSKVFKERKKQHEKELQVMRQEAAERAQKIIFNSKEARDDNPYLQSKGVHTVPGLFESELKNICSLVVPVTSIDGHIMSCQFITAGQSKRFLCKGEVSGGFFEIKQKKECKQDVLYMVEGIATALSVHEATEGGRVLCCFDCNNLQKVASIVRTTYPNQIICIVADNDWSNVLNGKSNPGLDAAQKAAAVIGARIVIPPVDGIKFPNGKAATDANDYHQLQGLQALQTCLSLSKSVEENYDCPMPEGYYLIKQGPKSGLYYAEKKGDNVNEYRLGPPIYVKGMTRDAENNSWGLLLEWNDPDDKLHQWAMPLDLLSKDTSDWHAFLVNGGWLGDLRCKRNLSLFFSLVRSKKRIRCVPSIGWHENVFVLPDIVYGTSNVGDIVLQIGLSTQGYRVSGSFDEWKALAMYASGNSRLIVSLSAAFAGPLLHVLGLESGGFNYVGGSSIGKSTTLCLAASVWDAPSFIKSWRATDNGLEGHATQHNDTLLILDELGQASSKTVSEVAYMLTNGQGKTRAGRDGKVRRQHNWRLLFLSSGEIGLADKLIEIGQKVHAGQEVRLVDIPADAGVDMGIFENIHDHTDASNFSLHIKKLCAKHYGHAGRAFVAKLVSSYVEVQERVGGMMGAFVKLACPKGSDGQVKRVALRFAVCSVAGVLASEWGILPFEGSESFNAAQKCFKAWLDFRGTTRASEDTAILSSVSLFIEQHGSSRFENIKTIEGQRIHNRVGFKNKVDGTTEYVVLPESFRTEVVKGYDERRAAKVLSTAGWLRRDQTNRNKCRRLLPELGRQYCYVLVLPSSDLTEDKE